MLIPIVIASFTAGKITLYLEFIQGSKVL